MGRDARRLIAGLIIGLLALSGCGQSFISSNTQAGKDQERKSTDDPPPPADRDFVLIPAGPRQMSVTAGKTAPVKVFVIKKNSGDPAVDTKVTFEVTSGDDLGALSSGSRFSDEEGAAGTTFRSARMSGTATVKASNPKAKPLEFTLQIDPKPSGKLKLNLVNTGASVMPLSDVSVRLYDNDNFACDEFQPLKTDQPDPIKAKVRPQAGSSVAFGALSTDEKFTATAVARGNRGQIAAGGCKDELKVPAEGVRESELLLHLVPLNPNGRYEVTSHYDFSQALEESGVVGKNIVRVLKIFEDPGGAIYDQIIRLVKNLVGGFISQGIDTLLDKTGLDSKFKNMINDAVQNNETLCRVREVGRDVRDVVSYLEVQSEMSIGTVGTKYKVQGRNDWMNITLYWRAKCQDAIEEVCSKDEDTSSEQKRKKPCAAINLFPNGQNSELGDIGVWASQWEGRVTSYNRLQIQRHPLPLRYGRLIEFIMSQVILPEMTDGNAHSLVDAFSYWLGCGSLAKDITGSDGKQCALGQCITKNDIEGFCKSAIGTVFGAADLAISNLEYDTGIYVGGEATLVETTSDSKVDYIEEGSYDGYIEVNDEKGSQGRTNVTGDWTGERVSKQKVSQ